LTARTLSFGSLSLAYTAADPPSSRLLDFAFGSQPLAPSTAPLHHTELACDETSGEFILTQDGQPPHRASSAGAAALTLIERATFQLADPCRDGPLLHAACLSRAGQAVLLPGGSGSGKTCLATWLLTQGWDYLTDELVLLLPESDGPTCRGFARPLNLKSSAAPLFPALIAHPSTLSTSFGHLVSPETALAQAATPGLVLAQVPLTRIIFPAFRQDALFEFSPLPKAKTVFLLMQCLINARNLPGHGLDALTAICQSIPAFRLQYSGFASLASIIN
jgi:hypothetical protein